MAAAPRSMQVNRRVKCIHTHTYTLCTLHSHIVLEQTKLIKSLQPDEPGAIISTVQLWEVRKRVRLTSGRAGILCVHLTLFPFPSGHRGRLHFPDSHLCTVYGLITTLPHNPFLGFSSSGKLEMP